MNASCSYKSLSNNGTQVNTTGVVSMGEVEKENSLVSSLNNKFHTCIFDSAQIKKVAVSALPVSRLLANCGAGAIKGVGKAAEMAWYVR